MGPFLVGTSGFWPLGSRVQRRNGAAQVVGCFEARQSLAFRGEGVGDSKKTCCMREEGPAGKRPPLAASRSAPGEPPALRGCRPEPWPGVGRGGGGGAVIPRAQGCGARSSGLVSQSPSPARDPHPRAGECRGRGRLHPGREGRPRRAEPPPSPPLRARGCQVSCFGEKNQQNPRQKGRRRERAWRGLAGPGRPDPGPRAVPAASAGAGSRAGRLCAPINLPAGGGRAGWGLFVTLLPRSPRSPGSGLRRSLPLAAAASAGAICCCRFWRSAIQKQTSSMTTNSYSQMY